MGDPPLVHPMFKAAFRFPRLAFFLFLLSFRTTSGKFPSQMQYLVVEASFAPLQSVYVLIQVGSAYETPETSGLSHLLEHLLFDGTQQYSRSELKREFDRLGIYVNAFTREDYTAFFITASPKEIPRGLELLFQMLFHSVLPEEELEKERNVVIEEMRKDRMNPRILLDEAFHNAFPVSYPYRLPVIGLEENLRNITRQQVQDFYRSFYEPNRMTLLTYGPLSSIDFHNLISGISLPTFENIGENEETSDLPSFPMSRWIKGRYESAHLYLMLPAPVKSLQHLIAYEWFENWASQNWKAEEFSARGISINFFPYRLDPYIRIHLELSRDGTEEKVEKILQEKIRQFLYGYSHIKDFQRIMKTIQAEKIYLSENSTYFGMWLADFVGRGVELHPEKYFQVLQIASFSQLLDILRQEWKELDWRYVEFRRDKESPAKSPLMERKLENGMQLIAFQRKGSPVFAVNALVLNPLNAEPEHRSGLHTLFQMLWGKETALHSEQEMSEFHQEISLRMKTTDDPYLPFDDYYFSPFYSYLRLETLYEHWETALDLFIEILRKSRFSEEMLQQERQSLKNLLKEIGNKADEKARDEVARQFFPSHPYGKNLRGHVSEVEAITPEEVNQYYRKTIQPQNLVVAMVGDVPPEDMIQYVQQRVLDWPAGEIQDFSLPEPGEGKYVVPVEGKTGAVRLHCPVPGARSAEAPTIQMASLILSDRLSEVIREQKGYVYTISSSVEFHPDFGIWKIVYVTGGEHLEASLNAVLSLLEDFKQRTVSAEKLALALIRWKAQYMRYTQASINFAHFLSLFSFLTGYAENALMPWKDMEKISAEQLQEMAQKYLKPKQCVLAFVVPSE